MTKIKNTKKGMAKKTLSMSLVVAMLATSNVPVWAAEFSDGTDTTNITSEANAFTDAEADTPVVNDASSDVVSAQATTLTFTADSTKKVFDLENNGLTVNTNYVDGTNNDFGCISFVLRKDNTTPLPSNNEAMNQAKDRFEQLGWYVTKTGENDHVTKNGAAYTLNLGSVDKAKYIGKTITAILYQDTVSASGYATNNGNVLRTVDIKVTADDSYDCVGNRFTKDMGWGTSLDDIKASLVNDNAYTLKYGATVSKYIWRDQNDAEVADTTKATTKDDVNKTYSLYATLQGDAVPDNDEVYLGQITITSAGIVNSEVSSVEWDCTTDGDGNPKFTYDGTAHYPKIKKVVLKDGTVINEGDKDTTITYADITVAQHTNANTGISYPVTIKTANYSLTYTKNLVIEQADLATGADLAVTKGFEFDPNNTYTVANKEDAKKVGLSVSKSGTNLEVGTDYSVQVVSSPENKVGTENAFVTVTGNGNYKGTLTKKAPITAYGLNDNTVTITGIDATAVYDGNAKEFDSIKVKTKTSPEKELKKDTDYTVSYSNNKEVGTASVTITGKGNYSGSITKTFEITSAKTAFTDELIADIQSDFDTAKSNGKTTYTGKAIDLVKDAYRSLKYVKNRDFTVEYVPQNVNAGDVEVRITGINNYKGCKGTINFKIKQRPITDKDVKVSIQGLTYSADMTDKQIKDAVTLTYNGMTLVENTDYKIWNISKSGKNVTLSIEGLGNYDGYRTETVSVTAKDISTVTLPKIEAQKYTGSDIRITNGKVGDSKFEIKDGKYTLVEGTDYKIAGYENNKNVGTATINIVGVGAYSGKAAVSFPIVAAELNGTIVYRGANGDTPVIPDQEYDYEKITSSNGYTFDIADKNDNSSINKLRVIDKEGKVVDPDNYTVTYKDNTAAGTATITVEGKTGYKLNAVNTFRIVPAKLTKASITKTFTRKDSDTIYYTGEEIKPAMNVSITDGTTQKYTLVEGKDYKIEYSDNINVGKGKAKLVGLGNYAGTVKDVDVTTANNLLVEFDINKTVIKSTDVVATDVAYAGGVLVTPNITVKNPNSNKALVAGTDYTVEVIDGGINVGKATATIKLTDSTYKNCEFGYNAQEYDVTFNVTAQSLANVTVNPIADQVATGEQIKPAITVMNGSVKLTEGKDYEVSYGENKEIGEGTVTIKALSSNKNYTGSQTVKFNIVKDAPVVGKTMISDVKVVGNKATVILSGDADGASGYDYVISTDKDCTTSKDYDAISKNQVKTSTAFKYVQKGTYYAYCHAWTRDKNGKKVFGDWSEGYEFKVKATTPAAPVITEVKVKGSTITVTYNKVSNVAGYDVVLGTSSKNDNGELRPYRYGDHKILNINKNKVTVQFKKVPKKNWVVGMRSFTKDPDTNKKVFSRWSNLMPANVE